MRELESKASIWKCSIIKVRVRFSAALCPSSARKIRVLLAIYSFNDSITGERAAGCTPPIQANSHNHSSNDAKAQNQTETERAAPLLLVKPMLSDHRLGAFRSSQLQSPRSRALRP